MSTIKDKLRGIGKLRSDSELAVTLSYLLRNRLAIVGIFLIAGVIFCAIFAPFIAPYDPLDQNIDKMFSLPSLEHPLGCDELGRDILSRIIHGTRFSLMVSSLVVTVSGIIGTLVGAISAYFGGKVDTIVMRVVDVVMSIPDIVLAIAIMVVAGPGLINLTIAMASTYWTRWARIVRSRVLSLREEDYVEASKVFGASNLRIISEHILPNVGPSVIVMATLTMSGAILYEAALSFIGFGVPPPAPSWGQMLATARQYMLIAGHLIYFPGIAITLTTLGFYLLGDGLRDALDPKLRID